MDHKMPSNKKHIHGSKDKLILPPISSMDTFYVSKSWPPLSDNLSASSPIESISGITMRMQESSIISPPVAAASNFNQTDHRYKHPHHHYQNNRFSGKPNTRHTLYSQHQFYQAPQSSFSEFANHQNNPMPISESIPGVDKGCNRALQLEGEIKLASTHSPFEVTSNFEEDIDKVILHCNRLSSNMESQKRQMTQNSGMLEHPWLDDMIGKANEVLNALLRLRKTQIAAEQKRCFQNDIERQKSKLYDSSSENPLATSSGILSFSSIRNRKRAAYKRPVFQGRCHSCNISETPEWRRGPDGARTLCNACGLHYAKLARKKNKQNNMKSRGPEE